MLHPCITQPTIIENIFINSNEEPISGNIINRISDHFPNFIVIKTEKPKEITETTHYKRNMKNYNPIIYIYIFFFNSFFLIPIQMNNNIQKIKYIQKILYDWGTSQSLQMFD